MNIIHLNEPYSYNNMVRNVSMLNLLYPDFIHTAVIGNSVLNRSILMLRVGRGDKKIVLTSGVHGRESINPIVLMAMMETYAETYYDKRKAAEWLEKEKVDLIQFFEEYTLCVVPLVNPDGYMIALRGYDMIHSEQLRERAIGSHVPYEEWKFNARGIDINRNFPSKNWKKKFEGDEPATEPETKALIRLFQEYDSCAYVDYHSRGNEIYYYRKQLGTEYNERQLSIAERLEKTTGYTLVNPADEIDASDTGGNTVHYYSEYFEKPAITIETVPEKEGFPLPVSYQEITYRQILYTPFWIM